MKEYPKQWVRMASGNSASSLAMYERDAREAGLPVKVEKDVAGRWVLYQLIENRIPHAERRYMAVARHNGKYGVSEIYAGCADLHPVGDCRDFDTWDEADSVARRIAAGEFSDIRPAGEYVCNR